MPNNKTLEEIISQRGKYYGNPKQAFENAGKAVTAILQSHYGLQLSHDIPPHVMAQIMVVIKVLRSVKQAPYLQDNYDDQANYTILAEQVDTRRPIEE